MLKVENKIYLDWKDLDELVDTLCHKISPKTLVVDDICDSGKTLSDLAGGYSAVLHYKPHTSLYVPDIYAVVHEGDEWIIYPWERGDSAPIQDYLKR